MQITNMSKEHLDFLCENLNAFDEFWNENILKNEFYNENSKYFIMLQNDEILGFAGLWFNIDEAHIMNIAIRKDFRRNHLGENLLKYLIEYSKDREKVCITLEVEENNFPAIGLYKKSGFEEIGRRKKYYNNKFDAIIMTKKF